MPDQSAKDAYEAVLMLSTRWAVTPDYKGGETPVDADHDGMADYWEMKKGLDPDDTGDGNSYTLNKNYTNLEVYLNSLIDEKK